MNLVRTVVSWLGASAMAGLIAAIAYGMALTALAAVTEIASGDGSGTWLVTGMMSVFPATPVHILGIAALGPLAQLVLRRAGLDGKRMATLVGAGLATLAAAALFSWLIPVAGLAVLALVLPAPISGAVGGWTYRELITPEAKPRPAPPS